jgi:hypothetical protein
MLIALGLMLLVPGLAAGVVAENMHFNPLPQPGDTSVSGTCDQTEGCDGMIEVVMDNSGVPGEDVQVIGIGFCEGGSFTIDLCTNIKGSAPTGSCMPYALKRGDVISVGQFLGDGFGGQEPLQPENLCDSTAWFTVGLGIPAIAPWGVVILSILLALSAIVLIRRRRTN